MKKLLIAFLFCITLTEADAQANYDAFIRYVSTHIEVSDSLKYDCNWHYAIVRLRTNNLGKVTRYECLNPIDNDFKSRFKFLVGYQFPAHLKVKGRPVVFYFALDNSRVCNYLASYVPTDPNDVVGLITFYLQQVKKDNRSTIFIPERILKGFYPPQN